ncbi:MAG: NADH-quinone oxidoreductase subunit C [Gemmataceae bacterium]
MAFDDLLKQQFGDDVIELSEFRNNRRVIVPAERLYEVLQFLKESAGFNMLAEINSVDYLKYPNARDRYGVNYVLTNLDTGERAMVRTYVNDPDPKLPSCYPLWKGANWLEREVFDMHGVLFEGHPDLRRILMPPEFSSFPLRKDYPLRGKGERHNFPVITRAEG